MKKKGQVVSDENEFDKDTMSGIDVRSPNTTHTHTHTYTHTHMEPPLNTLSQYRPPVLEPRPFSQSFVLLSPPP